MFYNFKSFKSLTLLFHNNNAQKKKNILLKYSSNGVDY